MIAVGGGLCTVTAPAAVAADAPGPGAGDQDAVLPPFFLPTMTIEEPVEAGATGYLSTRVENGKRLKYWTDYATGQSRVVAPVIADELGHSGLRAESDYELKPDGSYDVRITDLSDGSVTTVNVPQGYVWTEGYTADSVIVYQEKQDGTVGSASVLRRTADGTIDEQPITGLPEGQRQAIVYPREQDARGAILRIGDTDEFWAVPYDLDYETGRVTPVHKALDDLRVVAERHLLNFQAYEDRFTTLERSNPEALPVVTEVPKRAAGEGFIIEYSVVGDWILYTRSNTGDPSLPGVRLYATPIGGGQTRELARYSSPHFAVAPDGSVLVTAGSGPRDWAVRRVTAAPGGTPELTTVRALPPVKSKVDALALGAGKLSYIALTEESRLVTMYDHEVTGSGTLSIGKREHRSRLVNDIPSDLHALGDGRSAYPAVNGIHVPITLSSFSFVHVPGTARLVDATGRYSVINGRDGRQRIGDLEVYNGDNVVLTRPVTAATVWGSTLWTPGKTTGSVVSYDLKSRKSSPDLALGSGCVPNDLQAVGRWVYWSCGSGQTAKSGVWDQKTRISTPLPAAGAARLGDGFVVRQDGGKLLLSDFHTGSGTATTTEFAELPANGKWAVDKFGGHVAFTDADQAVRIRPVTVPRSPVGVIEAEADSTAALHRTGEESTWDGAFQLSRPPAGWRVVVQDAKGRTIRTISSTERTGAKITASWDGRNDSGKKVRGGGYTVTLGADGGDGNGLKQVWTGKVAISGGLDGPRDHDGDGVPEVLTRSGKDLIAHEQLTRDWSSGLSTTVSRGWTGINAVVPMGDMTGDGCNDIVVRTDTGDLNRHSGNCAGVPGPTSPKLKIGAGFGTFDTVLTPGDLTGDGRPDLLARQKSTGLLYMYADKGSGTLKPGVKFSGNWKGLTLIGAGDLNGDRHGDLLVRDAGGELWRYNGNGKGGFAPRALVFKDWGVGRNAFVGMVDLNADGKYDLLSRDTKGRLFGNMGTGKGSFRATVQLGTGWQRYTTLH
ncbi:FG-GAP-like repeat-containing protein [Streptomyces sp. NPDC004726]